MTERDEQLELKKRARRRLVGAAAFALLAVVALPMVMDETPPPNAPQVQIRIPGQDEPLPPPTAAKPALAPATVPATVPAGDDKATAGGQAPAVAATSAKSGDKAGDKAPAEKPTAKADSEKPAARPEAGRQPAGEAERAAAILQGKDAGEQHVILIGAFADPANVKTLQRKLAELGIKTYTEPLESPTGRKTRLRAGPFPSREAAEKARERMKRIGVNGVLSTKS